MNVANYYFRLLCLLLFLSSPLSACSDNNKTSVNPVNDFTARIEMLGNPYQARYKEGADVYARNIWDMQTFQGAIYLGAGNSSNDGPAPNNGPVPIIKFDPATQKFIQEGSVDDEQIDVYHIFNDELYTPGHDPRENWDWGNFYRREKNGTWAKYRNIPNGVHAYSMAWFDERLMGSLNVKEDGAAVSISKDKGKTWTDIPIGRSRVYGFLNVANTLYAVKRFPSFKQWNRMAEDERDQYRPVYEYKSPDIFIPRKDIEQETFFPQTALRDSKTMKIVRPIAVGGKGVYIGAYTHNDHQFIPFGVYVASSLEKGRLQVDKMSIPDKYKPWDLLLKDGYLYVLVEDSSNDKTLVKVIRSPANKLNDWSELLQFSAPTFARSFEILGGDFYFGLGCEIENPNHWKQSELRQETGQIIRIKHAVPK